jgi:hypothetical protein
MKFLCARSSARTERRTTNPSAAGSNPAGRTKKCLGDCYAETRPRIFVVPIRIRKLPK